MRLGMERRWIWRLIPRIEGFVVLKGWGGRGEVWWAEIAFW